jgi:hypothetical protein
MSIKQFPLPETDAEVPPSKQIIMILLNVDPVNPDVRFVPERPARDGWNPFDIDLTTVTGGKPEQVSVRVVILQDGLAFMVGDADVTAGCEYSQKHLRRLSPCSPKPVKHVEFLVDPLNPGDPDLEFNLGLIAAGTAKDSNDAPVRWKLPFVLDPKIRNM